MRSRRSGSWFSAFVILLLVGGLLGCSHGGKHHAASAGNGDDSGAGDDDSGPDSDDDTGASPCDSSRRPIVFVHGFIDSGGTFALPAMRFASNGYCPERIFTFDWNSLSFNQAPQRAALGALIDAVLSATGASQVDLIGHSAGGELCASYLNEPGHAAKVAHYAHLASFGVTSPPGGVPTMDLSSPDDPIAGPSDIAGATNVKVPGADHLQVVTSAESFGHLYSFFNDAEPATLEIVPEEDILLWGRVVSLGENVPGSGYQVRVFEVDPTTGDRLAAQPVAEFTADIGGYFGPFAGKPDTYYEYWCIPTDPNLIPVHYYREPVPRTNGLVYLRTFPGPGSLVGTLLRTIDYADDHAVVVNFTADQSAVVGRDSLIADGFDLTASGLAEPQHSTIAVFLFDANKNGQTDAVPAGGLFGTMPFLAGFDDLIPSEPPRAVSLSFNGRSMSVPNLKSRSEGVPIAVFD